MNLRQSLAWLRFTLRRRIFSRMILYLAFFELVLIGYLLPYDNGLRLSMHARIGTITVAFKAPFASDKWLFDRQEFPINMANDTLVILRTRYSSARDRVPVWLKAMGSSNEFRDIVVVGDWATRDGEHFHVGDRVYPVVDAVGITTERLVSSGYSDHPRVLQHARLAKAIENGETELGFEMSFSFAGREMDPLKFVASLEDAYKKYPEKKWFILCGDNTFVVQQSLKLILGHLDPNKTYYLGSAHGVPKERYADGSAPIVLSREALYTLFVRNKKIVETAHVETLSAANGDRVLARALRRSGVYVKDDYSRFFNGDLPLVSKIRVDRLCAPVVSLGSLESVSLHQQVGDKFSSRGRRPTLWIDLWTMYDAPALAKFMSWPIRQNWDHIGRYGASDITILHKVETVHHCLENCNQARDCLAWAWNKEARQCYLSPWMAVGEGTANMMSGLNVLLAERLESKCHR